MAMFGHEYGLLRYKFETREASESVFIANIEQLPTRRFLL